MAKFIDAGNSPKYFG